MLSTLELCEKYFDTRDVYKLFNVEKTADEKELKKSYYKLSLLVHPDRVPETQKETATEKFKLLSKLYQIFSDKSKRALYDEKGIIDDDDDDDDDDDVDDERFKAKLETWLKLWRSLFKPLTEEDIINYEKAYVGSDAEKADIKRAYLTGKGCKNFMISSVPFMRVKDEPRVQEVVREMIATGEVPEYKQFTEEPASKRNKRHKRYAREVKKSEKEKAKLEKNKKKAEAAADSDAAGSSSLEQTILAIQKKREDHFNSFFDQLAAKYGNDENDDDDVIDFSRNEKIGKTKKKSQKKSSNKNSSLRTVKTGKVKKR